MMAGYQTEQAHLGDAAQQEVIRLAVEPLFGHAVVDVPAPDCGEPYADIHQNH